MKVLTHVALFFIIICNTYAQEYGWSVIYKPPDAAATVIDFYDSTHGWIESWNGIRRTTDGGRVWSEPFTKLNAVVESIKFFNRKEGWAVASNFTPTAAVYKSTDSGKTWQELYRNDRIRFYGKAITRNKVIAAGLKDYNTPLPDTAVIVRTTDGGTTFKEEAYLDSPFVYFRTLDFTDSLHGWIYGEYDSTGTSIYVTNGMFLWTSDGGGSWKKINVMDPTFRFKAICFIDSINGWAWSSSFYRTSNGGKNWLEIWKPPQVNYRDPSFTKIFFLDSLSGWACGDGFIYGGARELIWKTEDGGYSWKEESVGLSRYAYDIKMLSKTLGYVAADEVVLKYGAITDVSMPPHKIPPGYRLKDNYPNPFNPSTTIGYELPERTRVELKVYDVLGKEIAILVSEEQGAGVYSKEFDARGLPSGIYFYEITTKNFERVKQMMLLK